MKEIKFFFSSWGIHCFLIPVFFILHGYLQYYGTVPAIAAIKTLVLVEFCFLTCFLVIWFLWKNANAVLNVTALLGLLYLLFGDIKELLATTPFVFVLSRYVFFLPALVVFAGVCIYIIRTKKTLRRLNLYLNTLFILFIVTDSIRLISLNRSLNAGKESLLGNRFVDKGIIAPNVPAPKDIYYLLFDSYPGWEMLKRMQRPSAISLDTFLANRNFYVVKDSKCNYNNTPFSMDATLNMSYLEKLENPGDLTPFDYNRALFDIDHAAVFKYLSRRGYQLYNLSPFTINGIKPIYRQEFATILPADLLMYSTALPMITRDIAWNVTRLSPSKKIAYADSPEFKADKQLDSGKKMFNATLLDSVPKIAEDGVTAPRFVYAHFFMPHYPYFYDECGQAYPDTSVYNISLVYDDKKFIGYLDYCNKKIIAMLTELLSATKGNSIIIVQSDHGYRGFAKKNIFNHFVNVDAMYFPDHRYGNLYDSMSNVNAFRMLFKTYFPGPVQLLADSCIVLKD